MCQLENSLQGKGVMTYCLKSEFREALNSYVKWGRELYDDVDVRDALLTVLQWLTKTLVQKASKAGVVDKMREKGGNSNNPTGASLAGTS